MSIVARREPWADLPIDTRPVIGNCAECGHELHTEDGSFLEDRIILFGKGEMCHVGCLHYYCRKFLLPQDRPESVWCEECGRELKGEDEDYYAEDAYKFEDVVCCEDCYEQYLIDNYKL